MCGDVHRVFKEIRAVFYSACLQECAAIFHYVLRYTECIVQTSNPGAFALLWAVSL